MSKKKILIFGLVILAIFLAYRFWGNPRSDPDKIKVERKNLETYIEASGKLKATQEVVLSFPLLGSLEMVASSSTQVKKGEIVARLKTNELWANLQQAYAGLNKARSNFYYYLEVKSQTDSNSAWKEDAVSKALVNQANNNVAGAKDAEEAAQFAVDASKAAYNKAFLKAPFDGVVAESTLNVGETVAAGQKILRLLSPEGYFFETEVDETEVGLLKIGQAAKVTLDALAKETFEGKIYQIDAAAHTTASGGTSYTVKISLENKKAEWRSGYNGQARFVKERKEGVLFVPAIFIFSENGQSSVWVLTGGRKIKQAVGLGEFFDGGYEVISGLKEGDVLSAPVKK